MQTGRKSRLDKPRVFAVVFLIGAAVLIGPSTLSAQETADIRYVALQPAFIANFGVTEQGHLKYVKAEISIRVSSQKAEMAARYHLPALRNSLVLLLSRQDEVTVTTGSGREAIREEALMELRAVLKAEEGQPYIDDLMFTNFVVQQ